MKLHFATETIWSDKNHSNKALFQFWRAVLNGDRNAIDTTVYNCDNHIQPWLVYDPLDWVSDNETLVPIVKNLQSSATQKHIPSGMHKVETREQMVLQAAWYVKSDCCQHCLYTSIVQKDRSDVITNITYFEQMYTFIIDNDQNMEIPFCR